MRDHL